jgi:hypothetical protein
LPTFCCCRKSHMLDCGLSLRRIPGLPGLKPVHFSLCWMRQRVLPGLLAAQDWHAPPVPGHFLPFLVQWAAGADRTFRPAAVLRLQPLKPAMEIGQNRLQVRINSGIDWSRSMLQRSRTIPKEQ